ncbi:hypothetical protein MGG_15822 [Pyricularia oryzae 70-15]|uniref:Uncharacterized protein n=2 Tax=Pyricularia oryzae TaxID=318829 RepID=G4MYD7_PYRO7|nr:uncharacterized protein MGG_15822 [Pyricularia oryzae 70-15]EHA55272.1 hypothetical protein MGG_15822 [Pyricularia oryzae 70-15]KAI7916045.1 hypothetical protein M0657_008799 [Pyricularia oryzae]KAI7926236.1 hypothetical protein M9X92_002826 [Pyricularia oryzae]QBZ56952.1 hypothetical protein PoMZ_01870 [Pyricularia oryzae]
MLGGVGGGGWLLGQEGTIKQGAYRVTMMFDGGASAGLQLALKIDSQRFANCIIEGSLHSGYCSLLVVI